eukprot:365129-Chlamydomonas_euryale.AAC.20
MRGQGHVARAPRAGAPVVRTCKVSMKATKNSCTTHLQGAKEGINKLLHVEAAAAVRVRVQEGLVHLQRVRQPHANREGANVGGG